MPGPSANPTACAVVRKPIQRPCFESGIVSPTIDIAAGIKPESNMPSTKRMGMNSSGTLTNASSRLVTIKPAREMKRMGLRPMRPDHMPIGVLKRNIPRPKAPSINASISGPSPRACKRCGKTGIITAKPVIIRVTQPIRNTRAAVIDRDFFAGEAAMGLALTTSCRGMVTVSRSRTAVFICLILSDLVKGSDNTLTTYPLPSLTLVVLFPSRVYNLQFASNLCISVLPDPPKTGNQRPLRSQTHGEIRHSRKKQQGSRREPCCFAEVRGSAPLGVTSRKGAVLDELTQKTLLAYKNRAAALHRFTNESDHLLSVGLHQGNPGCRGSGVWVVFSTPVRHFHQDRDEIQTCF